jgi:predicted acyl esterase
VAVLQEVAADGAATDLTTGALSVPHGVGTLEQPRPAATGTALDLHVRLVPVETTIPAGNRLRLVLGGQHDRAVPAGTGWSATAQLGAATRLLLPIVTRDCGLVVRSAVRPRRLPSGC